MAAAGAEKSAPFGPISGRSLHGKADSFRRFSQSRQIFIYLSDLTELFYGWTEAVYALTMLIPKTMLRATSERAGKVFNLPVRGPEAPG
jgi:hypothetical protein